MPNSKIFSTFDALHGYWQIELDEESSKLCTFQTPWGRYRFKRLPFGISTSGDAFIQALTEKFSNLEGVEVIVDDILVHGRNIEEHNGRVEAMLQRASEIGLTINPNKVKYQLKEVHYCGHVISENGLKPSPDHIKPILGMPTPANKEEIRRFLALVGYLHKFLPNLADISKPLRQLLENKVAWSWEPHHEDAFQKLKHMVTTTPVLKLYDVNKNITLQVDSSREGLGAALLQDDRPVLYASKSLNETQSRYAVIERELLAICYACQRFHQYVYGKQITIQTDHKPLISIMQKQAHKVCIGHNELVLSCIEKFKFDLEMKVQVK
jgi:hypothetical protein